MNKAQKIIEIIKREYDKALENYRLRAAERVGQDAAANIWDEFNRNDGVGDFRQNPYNKIEFITREERAKAYFSTMQQIYDYAIKTFLEKVDE